MAKILLVEDDHHAAQVVLTWLQSERHVVELANDGHKALEYMRMIEYDLILLDWDLPGMSGYELLRQYRASGKATPVIMVTAKATDDDKTTGLDGGADDYLTKPYSLKELSARIRARLRTTANVSGNDLVLREIVLSPEQLRVTRNGTEIKLLLKEFNLLEFFMRNPDRVFTAEAVISRIWPSETEVSANAFHSALKRLRQKLEATPKESLQNQPSPDQTPLIETIHGAGYRFNSR